MSASRSEKMTLITNSPMGEDRLVISVKEARKLLGKDSNNLSDDYIEKLIRSLSLLSESLLVSSI